MPSGTTILHRLLLSAIPSAVDIDPLDFEGRVFWQKQGIPMGSPKTGTYCDCHQGHSLAVETREIIRQHFAHLNNIIITKNPHLNNKIGLIQSLFPNAKIIHLIRQNLAVIASTKLRFEEAYSGRNYLKVPVKHYWPLVDLPCWWCVPETLERPPNFQARAGVPPPQHEDYPNFLKKHPELDRYFPGAGFKRIAESWLQLNANIIRQVSTLNLQDNYLAVYYEELVLDPRAILTQIAEFCQLGTIKQDCVPSRLSMESLEKWRETLTTHEQQLCTQVVKDFSQEAELISRKLSSTLII
jgi:hypothetical protein